LRLYVITVNYNSELKLRRLVESLSSTGFVEKLVVVSHSPGDRLESLEADFPIQVIHQRNIGYGAGLNRGLQEIRDADGLILLCNPDIVFLNHEQIQSVWRYMNDNSGVGLIIPALVDAQRRPISSCRKFYSLRSLLLVSSPWLRKLAPNFCADHYYGQRPGNGPLEVDWGSGAAMFIRGPVANHGPLFDERFFLYFEDVDLCARMWQENRSVVYFPDLVCQHSEARLSHKKVRYFVTHLFSLIKFIIKYGGLPRRSALQGHKSVLEKGEEALDESRLP
jgi:GT2 family glycosyltransferase